MSVDKLCLLADTSCLSADMLCLLVELLGLSTDTFCCIISKCIWLVSKKTLFTTRHVNTVLLLFTELFTFNNCMVPIGFLLWEIRVAFPGESQLRQSRSTQPTVHAGCFSVSITHRTLTWTTGSLSSAQM